VVILNFYKQNLVTNCSFDSVNFYEPLYNFKMFVTKVNFSFSQSPIFNIMFMLFSGLLGSDCLIHYLQMKALWQVQTHRKIMHLVCVA